MLQGFVKQVGVTLLEIMLVLAIAAMVIIMSIRYYQSATIAARANAFLAQMQAIMTAADSLAADSGSYQDVNTTKLTAMLGEKWDTTPWGSKIQVPTYGSAAVSDAAKRIPFIVKIPAKVCEIVMRQLAATKRWTIGHYTDLPDASIDITGKCDPTDGYIGNTYNALSLNMNKIP